jgi:16S rRNA (cytosine1402-N4)-methyltransferase
MLKSTSPPQLFSFVPKVVILVLVMLSVASGFASRSLLRSSLATRRLPASLLLSKPPHLSSVHNPFVVRSSLFSTTNNPEVVFIPPPSRRKEADERRPPKKLSRKQRELIEFQKLEQQQLEQQEEQQPPSSSSSSDPSPITIAIPLKSYASDFHSPVMVNEVLAAMFGTHLHLRSSSSSSEDNAPKPADDQAKLQVYIDCTLGGGGHSQAILEHLNRIHATDTEESSAQPKFILIGVDRDPEALKVASERLKVYSSKKQFAVVHSTFATLSSDKVQTAIANALSHGDQKKAPDYEVQSMLIDLGVSSHQIDESERGFSYMRDGPLDMRMNNESSNNEQSAKDLLNMLPASTLSKMFQVHGDEGMRKAEKIADAIVEARPLETTGELKAAVAKVVPEWNTRSRREGLVPTLSRIFQSLRIVVNNEDNELVDFLTQTAPTLLKDEGVLAVLTYHSNEDRVVKNIFKHNGLMESDKREKKDMYGNVMADENKTLIWQNVKPAVGDEEGGVGNGGRKKKGGTKGKAKEEEVEGNRRSRSGILRVGIRLGR